MQLYDQLAQQYDMLQMQSSTSRLDLAARFQARHLNLAAQYYVPKVSHQALREQNLLESFGEFSTIEREKERREKGRKKHRGVANNSLRSASASPSLRNLLL
jgi:hypothetical protein